MKAEGDRREVYNDITCHPVGSKRIDKFNEKHGLVDRRKGGDRRENHKLRLYWIDIQKKGSSEDFKTLNELYVGNLTLTR